MIRKTILVERLWFICLRGFIFIILNLGILDGIQTVKYNWILCIVYEELNNYLDKVSLLNIWDILIYGFNFTHGISILPFSLVCSIRMEEAFIYFAMDYPFELINMCEKCKVYSQIFITKVKGWKIMAATNYGSLWIQNEKWKKKRVISLHVSPQWIWGASVCC